MALKGKEKEKQSGSFTKYTGLFNGFVVAVNPTKEELGKLLDTTIEKDPEYTGSNPDSGAKRVTISFWLKEEKTSNMFNVRFSLEDTVNVSKSGKTQYINNIGTTSYADTEADLPSFFTEGGREYRKAKKGEDTLYKFLRSWLSNLDYRDSSTELMLDWKKLIAGKTDELKSAIKSFDTQTVCALATIRTTDDGKEYQGVYSYEFLSSWALDCFNGNNKKSYTSVNKFIEKIQDEQYGCKDYYELRPLEEYDPSKNVVGSTNSPVINSNTSVTAPQVVDVAADDLPF